MYDLKGFTLIELLVVIVIISLLTAIGLPVYKDYRTRADIIAVNQSIERVIGRSLEYYSRNSNFPTAADIYAADGVTNELDNPEQIHPDITFLAFGRTTLSCNVDILTMQGIIDNSNFDGGFSFQYFIYAEPNSDVIGVLCAEGTVAGGLSDSQDFLNCPPGINSVATLVSDIEALACP